MMPPTRVARYCCDELKECYGAGRLLVFGVRTAESVKRKLGHGIVTAYGGKDKRKRYFDDNPETIEIVNTCYTRQKHSINPIIEWEDCDVWEFIKMEKLPYCGLYDDGMKRLGCIGCPMARESCIQEFIRWPKYFDLYMRAFERMVSERERRGKNQGITHFKSAEETMLWWLDDRNMDKQPIRGQTEMDLEDETE